MTVRTRSGRHTRSRVLRSAAADRARAHAVKLSSTPIRRKSLRATPARRKVAAAPGLPSKLVTSPCDSTAQSLETAADKRSTSPHRLTQPRFITPDSPEITKYTLQWLRTSNRTHLEGWLKQQADPQMQLDPKTPPRTKPEKLEHLLNFQEPERGRRSRRTLERETSHNSTSTQWRTGIDNMSPAPSLAPKGLTRNLGMSPEQKRRMPP